MRKRRRPRPQPDRALTLDPGHCSTAPNADTGL